MKAAAYPLPKWETATPCGECGCPATAMMISDSIEGAHCGQCHDDAPMYRPETKDEYFDELLQADADHREIVGCDDVEIEVGPFGGD